MTENSKLYCLPQEVRSRRKEVKMDLIEICRALDELLPRLQNPTFSKVVAIENGVVKFENGVVYSLETYQRIQ